VQWKSRQGFAVNSINDIQLLNANFDSFLIDTTDGKKAQGTVGSVFVG